MFYTNKCSVSSPPATPWSQVVAKGRDRIDLGKVISPDRLGRSCDQAEAISTAVSDVPTTRGTTSSTLSRAQSAMSSASSAATRFRAL